jgi:hypothetical protein
MIMTKEKSIEVTIQPFERVLESLNSISSTAVLFTKSENDTENGRPIDKKIMDNIKIMARSVSLLGEFIIENNSNLFTPFRDATQWYSAGADIWLSVTTWKEAEQMSDTIKGALYLGSALAKGADILSRIEFGILSSVPNAGTVVGVSGGVFKIGRGSIDALDDRNELHEKIAGVSTGLSGIFDIIAKVIPHSIIITTGLSCTFMIAAGYFSDGNWVGGCVTIVIGSALSIAMGTALKKLLEKAMTSLLKTIMSAFKLTASPLATNPFTAAAALAIIIAIGTLLAQSLSNISFAQGGFPPANQHFIAREAGPELVGTLNGRNAVVNNDQIVEAVQIGVFHAWKEAWNDNSPNQQTIAKVFLDGKEIARSTSV